MRSEFRIIITMVVVLLLAPTLLLCAEDSVDPAATAPKVEFFLGYSYVRNTPESIGNRIDYLHGGSTSIAFNVNRHLGFVADFGGYNADRFGPNAPPTGGVVDASGKVFTFMAGPRISFRHDPVTPFVHTLFGAAHAGAVTIDDCTGFGCTPLESETGFAMALGGGLDINLHRRVALRLIQAEYLMTRFADRSTDVGETARQNDVRISAGLVFRFGGNHRSSPPAPLAPPPLPVSTESRPNRPPTMTCLAYRNSMVAGEHVQIAATANSPDNNPLTYTWSASGGRIIGSGSSVTFDSANMAPGQYTVTGRVEDGHDGTSFCLVELNVQAAQAPVPIVLERALALHSIYFPTGQPTVDNPNSGLTESQKVILRTLAADFKKYREFNPAARLTMEGHADDRASVEFNNALSERRVALSKSFLVEQGVPADRIETRSFGKQEQLDESQVRQQMESNPNLTLEHRQKLFANLKSIILAQNRRVDVVLSTTGQTSTRQYPFNAYDALILLEDKQLAK